MDGVDGVDVTMSQKTWLPRASHCPFGHVCSMVSRAPVGSQRLMSSPSQRRLPGSQTVASPGLVVVVVLPPHAEQSHPKPNSTPTDRPILEDIILPSPACRFQPYIATVRGVAPIENQRRTRINAGQESIQDQSDWQLPVPVGSDASLFEPGLAATARVVSRQGCASRIVQGNSRHPACGVFVAICAIPCRPFSCLVAPGSA